MLCYHRGQHRGVGRVLVSSSLRLRRCEGNAGREQVLVLMRVRHVVRRCRVDVVRPAGYRLSRQD